MSAFVVITIRKDYRFCSVQLRFLPLVRAQGSVAFLIRCDDLGERFSKVSKKSTFVETASKKSTMARLQGRVVPATYWQQAACPTRGGWNARCIDQGRRPPGQCDG